MKAPAQIVGAVFDLNGRAEYVRWHFFQMSYANVFVIVAMLVVFALAIGLRFPRGRHVAPSDDARTDVSESPTGPSRLGAVDRQQARSSPSLRSSDAPPSAAEMQAGEPDDTAAPDGSGVTETTAPSTWTGKVREAAVRTMPPERLLPESQPSYVSSWIYVFGAASIGALAVIVGSGAILALKGPAWWHETGIGHFFNSIHLWAVELFFFAMVVHLWGKFFMAAWRGGRSRTWMSGAVIFLVSMMTAFTGYVSQQNFDSQWISTQGKDAMNAIGVGAFFNPMNFGQMYSYHVLLLPIVVFALVAGHILLVRRHGVVPPLPHSSRSGLTRLKAASGAEAGRR
ncbi:MAG: cytochrome b N-terminal domain-containing protein [Solirubrobacteraceae bacterium]